MVPLNYGAPKAAAGLAERGLSRRRHRPTAAATLAAAVAARAYALNHRREQARAALEAADALMDRLPESERSDTWLTYGVPKHHVHRSPEGHTRALYGGGYDRGVPGVALGSHPPEPSAVRFLAPDRRECAVIALRRSRHFGHHDPALPCAPWTPRPATATPPPARCTTVPSCSPTACPCTWPQTTSRPRWSTLSASRTDRGPNAARRGAHGRPGRSTPRADSGRRSVSRCRCPASRKPYRYRRTAA